MKVRRQLKKLTAQLDNACRLLWDCEDARKYFSQFLSAVTGKPPERILQTPVAARKMLIWPKSVSGKEDQRVKQARDDGWLIVDFGPGYTFDRNRG